MKILLILLLSSIPEASLVALPVNLPNDLDLSTDVHKGNSVIENNCLSTCTDSTEDVGICDLTLKPLCLTTMVDFEEGNLINFVLKPGLVNLDFFSGQDKP